MTPEQFCYWLQGFVEIHGSFPTVDQWETIRDHLKQVFEKRTPDRITPIPMPNKDHVPGTPGIIPTIPNPYYTPPRTPGLPNHGEIIC